MHIHHLGVGCMLMTLTHLGVTHGSMSTSGHECHSIVYLCSSANLKTLSRSSYMGPLSCICNIVLDHSFQCMMFRSALGYYSQSYIQQEIALNAQMWAL